MKRRDISITTGAAVALQARFDTEMAGGHQPDLDRIDERISKLEAKP